MATPAAIQDRPKRELKVLSLGMTRTGSASMTKALEILGYKGVHHGVQATHSPLDWQVFSKACDSFYTTLPTYTGAPFTREDWDLIFGTYEAVTDMGSLFAIQLIEAYPEAKVILVERDIEEWYKSMDGAIFNTMWGLRADLVVDWLGPLHGFQGGRTIRKILLGFYGAKNVDEMRLHARDRYRRHYAEIRAAVPKERLLNFCLEDGWTPLCEFLDKEVPDVPFPVTNKQEEHVKRVRYKQNMFFKHVAKRFAINALTCAVGAGLVGVVLLGYRDVAQWAAMLKRNKFI